MFPIIFVAAAGLPAFGGGNNQAAPDSQKLNSRSGATASAVSFPQLSQWKSAVLSGNAAALEALYSTNPPAVTVIGKNESSDPVFEPRFWAATKSAGLTSLKTRIASVDSPQPGVHRVMFELEASMHPASGTQRAFAAIAQY